MDAAVRVENLTKRFGDFTAVDGISFDIAPGRIFGFLGSNGSGKSTTIRMLCGLLTPTSGKGTVLGYDIWTQAESIKRSIGYMSQRFGLYEDLTVEENLEFYAGAYDVPRSEVKSRKPALIEMAELTGRETALAGTLSGGWKQKLALACALIHKPKLLVLDEPTAGVDPVSRRTFWEIIHALPTQNVTVLVTTHYMDEAESCDEVSFIMGGKIIETGGTREIIEAHKARGLEDVFIEIVENVTQKKVRASFMDMKFLENSEDGGEPS